MGADREEKKVCTALNFQPEFSLLGGCIWGLTEKKNSWYSHEFLTRVFPGCGLMLADRETQSWNSHEVPIKISLAWQYTDGC
jgi:hypothetical protein